MSSTTERIAVALETIASELVKLNATQLAATLAVAAPTAVPAKPAAPAAPSNGPKPASDKQVNFVMVLRKQLGLPRADRNEFAGMPSLAISKLIGELKGQLH